MLETANQEVETIFHEVAQATPRIMRDIESINQQALLLKQHMSNVENDFREMHIDDNEAIRELERLDCERQRAKKASDALHEANRWSMLVNSRQAMVEGDTNVDELYQLTLAMDQSLVYLEQMPDYPNRKALLNATKDRLEALVAPQFMELLDALTRSADAQVTANLQHLISIFTGLNRSAVAVRYYTTWLVNHMKETWDESNGITIDINASSDRVASRVQTYFRDTINFIENQTELKLFLNESKAPILRALVDTLDSISVQITQTLSTDSTSPSTRLARCDGLLEASEEFADHLCHLLKADDDSNLEVCFEVVRKLSSPLSAISEVFESYADAKLEDIRNIIQPSYTDEATLLLDLQKTSDDLAEVLEELLALALSQTGGLALPSLLKAVHTTTTALAERWRGTLASFAGRLIEQDRASRYEQAIGTRTALSFVSATGTLSMAIRGFVRKFDDHLGKVFQPLKSDPQRCSSPVCPFHSLLRPLIGESQPCANWRVLHPFAPQSDWLKEPTADASAPIMSSASLLRRFSDVCHAVVAMTQRVALTPVNHILAVVPKSTLWASNPASGEAKLPDLAYLPQEYITQLGQYIFNLFENLLPFMDASGDDASLGPESSAGLVHCLRVARPDSSQDHVNAVVTGNRSRLSSGAETISSPSTLTAWLDWLLSEQVAEAFAKAILEISSASRPPNNGGKPSPALTPHGTKQLLTDLDYFLGLLEELGLPQPGDLTCLRDLLSTSPKEFKSFSADKPPRLVAGVITLRML